MKIDLARRLTKIAGGRPNTELVDTIADGLVKYGSKFGLDRRSRQAHFVAQVAHESGRFRFNQEIWGPTTAQQRYEGRRDLGNTQRGDGYRFRGRGPIQLTGRANYRSFTKWCRANIGDAPDFEREPDAVAEPPWNFLAAVAYWDAFNPTGRSLNVYADQNNIEAVTRKINGGLNGFKDRCELYTRTALAFLGYDLAEGVVARFQRDAGLTGDAVDDIAGPQTRGLMHEALLKSSQKPADGHSDIPAPKNKPRTPSVAKSRGLGAAIGALIAAAAAAIAKILGVI